MKYAQSAARNLCLNQLEPAGISDPTLLKAFESVDRSQFVPETYAQSAYIDEEVPLGHGRYLPEPRVFAKMLQDALPLEGAKILDIACGLGYSTAILTAIGAEVYAVESQTEMAEQARKNLRLHKINASIYSTALVGGYAMQAPYDVAFIHGAVEELPKELLSQLKQGGRLYALMANSTDITNQRGIGTVYCFTRHGDHLTQQALFDASAFMIPELRKKPVFQL